MQLELVMKAAGKTTRETPLLEFAAEDYWPIKNCIVSSLQQQFSMGLLMHDMGLPTHSEWYIFGISCIPTKENSRKIRVYRHLNSDPIGLDSR